MPLYNSNTVTYTSSDVGNNKYAELAYQYEQGLSYTSDNYLSISGTAIINGDSYSITRFFTKTWGGRHLLYFYCPNYDKE